jgi:hypothetical protein
MNITDRPPTIECGYHEVAGILHRVEQAGAVCIRLDVKAGTYKLTLNWPKQVQTELGLANELPQSRHDAI